MDFHLVGSFAIATFAETLTPGPTLALVLETRAAKGRKAAASVVLGIALANIVWIALILFIGNQVRGTAHGALTIAVCQYLGATYLIYLATRRILSSAMRLISGTAGDDDYQHQEHATTMLWTGFAAHFFNPLTAPYYLSTFALAISDQPLGVAMLFAALPVLSDFVFYLAPAAVAAPRAARDAASPTSIGLFRLVAGVALLYLVARTLSVSDVTSATLELPGLIALLMLVGFLAGALGEAYDAIGMRKGLDNKLLWRVVALWGAWFSVLTLVGALYTLVDALDGKALALTPEVTSRIRICFVAAAVLAATLTFAKAYGELQDEQAGPAKPGTAITPYWTGHPLKAGLGAVAFLAVVFVLLVITRLQLK